MKTSYLKVIIYSPKESLDKILKVIAKYPQVGNYSHWSFVTEGIERFYPLQGATPVQGEVGSLELVESVRIETLCQSDDWSQMLQEIKLAHPYECPAIEVTPLIYPS